MAHSMWRRATTRLLIAVLVVLPSNHIPVPATVARLAAQPQAITSRAGTLRGDFDVTESGTARYRIPLAVATGRGGIQPKLTLSYDSAAGNGPLGVGWSLTGLSQIERCASMPATQGQRRPVLWDDADALCLDGQPLVLISGTAFTDGAEYRTLRQNFQRIIGVGTPHQRFRVQLPDGLTAEYGDADVCGSAAEGCRARALVKGIVVRSWALAALQDRFGNWMRIEWERRSSPIAGHAKDGTTPRETAEFLPVRIHYTGSTAAPKLEPQRRVEFHYEDRPDSSHGYAAGTRTMRTRRLSRVISLVGAEVYREYRVSYATSRASARSILSSVAECAGDGVCHPPTTFKWQDEQRFLSELGEEITPIVVGPGQRNVTRRPLVGGLTVADVNGDGRSDLVYVKERGNRRTWRLVLAYPTGDSAPNGNAPSLPACPDVTTGTYRCEIDTGIEAPEDVSAQVLDYDRDGRSDLLVVDTRTNVPRTTWKVLRSTGNGLSQVNTFVTDARFDPGTYQPVSRLHVADVNGDGGPDLLTCEPRPNVGPGQPWHVRYHTGNGWGQDGLVPFAPNGGQDCRAHVVMVLDANGDGAPDLLVGRYDSTYEAAIFTGESVTYQPTGISTIVGYFWQGAGKTFFTGARTADVNGDGLLDVIADRDLPQSAGTLDVWLNTGQRFASAAGSTGGYFGVQDQAVTATLGMAQSIDYNGDRRGDLLITTACPPGATVGTGPCSNNPRWQVLQATGTPVQYGQQGSAFVRRELSGCAAGGGSGGCLAHRTGPHQPKPINQWFGYQQTRVADVDGDLLPDLVMVENDVLVVRRTRGPIAGDRIVEIRNGLAWAERPTVQITYRPSTDSSVVESTTQRCDLPIVCERPDRVMVSSHAFDAGEGHEPVELRHTYAAPRRDSGGAGWLGFKEHTITNAVTGASTTTTFHDAVPVDLPGGRRAYPLATAPRYLESIIPLGSGRQRTVNVEYTVDVRRFDGIRTWYTTLERVVTTTRETIGNQTPVLAATTTDLGYDSWGNNSTIRVDTGVGVTTTTTQYVNDPSEWLIGLPRRLTVVDEVGGATSTRAQFRELDNRTGRVMRFETGSPPETIATFEYDVRGNPTAVVETDVTSKVARTTRSAYASDPEQMFPTEVTDPLGRVTRFANNRVLGVLEGRTDPNGFKVRFAHDAFGRGIRREQPGVPTLEYAYRLIDVSGESLMEVESIVQGGPRRVTRFDRLGRPLRRSRTLADGRISRVDIGFDRLGHVASVSAPYVNQPFGTGTWTYDALDRPVTHQRADGSTVAWAYRGLLTQYTDSLGHRTRVDLDAQDNPIAVTDAAGNSTNYEYGPFGALRRVTDAAGNVTEVTVDARGRILWQSNPDAGEMRFSYDGFGRLITTEDKLGRKTELTYDLLDRVMQRKNFDGTTAFTYDQGANALGRLSEAVGPTGIRESYEYDALGRAAAITTRVESVEAVRKVRYDDAGRLQSVNVSANNESPLALFYDYAPDGSVLRIRPAATAVAIWTAAAWNERGTVTREFVGSRVLTVRTIDPRTGRLEKVETIAAGSLERFQDLRYRYDTEGNIVERNDAVAGIDERFEHDVLDRVISSTLCPGGACGEPRKIDYDALGNIISKWDLGAYEYDGNSPHAVTRAGGVDFQYDAVGNQIRRGDEQRLFTALNLPSRIEQPGVAPETFDYDAFGRLARRRQGAAEVVYAGRGYERQTTAGGAVDRLTVDAGGRAVAIMTRQADKVVVRFVHPDALGSPTLLTDQEGKVAARTAFDVFGQQVPSASGASVAPSPVNLGSRSYTGHRQFEGSPLIHMGGRSYDPRLGRFLSADPLVGSPLNGQSLNRYSYALNNPLRYVDPTGFDSDPSHYHDFSDDPAYVEVEYDDIDEEDVDTPDVDDGELDSEEDPGYDDGDSDTDDGTPDSGENGPEWDFDGFEIEWKPDELIEDLRDWRDDVGESIGDAVDTLTDSDDDSDSDSDDEATAVGVLVTAAIVVGAGAVIYVGAKALLARAALGAGAGAVTNVPAPVDLPPPAPKAITRPVGLTPEPPLPPDTFQPPNGGINLGEDLLGEDMANMPRDPDGFTDVAIHGWANGFSINGQPVTPGQLADLIRADARYGGQGVRLVSCSPANGAAAQALANELGVPVKAVANDLIFSDLQPGMLSVDQMTFMGANNIPWQVSNPVVK